jgi:hypothetical protein
MMRLSKLIMASAIIVVAGMNGALATNLIVDGGFESPIVAGGTFETFNTGINIRAWLVIGPGCGNVTIVSTTYTNNGITFDAQAGNQYLDLTGTTDNGCPTGIQQTVATTAGHPTS